MLKPELGSGYESNESSEPCVLGFEVDHIPLGMRKLLIRWLVDPL